MEQSSMKLINIMLHLQLQFSQFLSYQTARNPIYHFLVYGNFTITQYLPKSNLYDLTPTNKFLFRNPLTLRSLICLSSICHRSISFCSYLLIQLLKNSTYNATACQTTYKYYHVHSATYQNHSDLLYLYYHILRCISIDINQSLRFPTKLDYSSHSEHVLIS